MLFSAQTRIIRVVSAAGGNTIRWVCDADSVLQSVTGVGTRSVLTFDPDLSWASFFTFAAQSYAADLATFVAGMDNLNFPIAENQVAYVAFENTGTAGILLLKLLS